MTEAIPDDIKLFLLQNIDSIAQWEGLLLLRSDPKQPWTADQLALRLYIEPAHAAVLLDSLVERQFIARQSIVKVLHYHYAPSTQEKAELVSRVADYYSRNLVPVTHLIHSKPKHKVQKFADAFKLKKEKPWE